MTITIWGDNSLQVTRNGVTITSPPFTGAEDIQAMDHIRSLAETVTDPQEDKIEELKAIAVEANPDKVGELVTQWQPSEYVREGWARSHDGKIYLVVQAHTTQNDWKPPDTPALWKELLRTTEGADVAEWKQPTGAHDAYGKGDRVLFEGSTWESLIDANTWSPKEYPQGWKKID